MFRALLVVLIALVILPLLAAPALADIWSDISDQQWEDHYGVTAEQASAVAEGFPDGTFRPYRDVTRGQFTKMAVDGLDLAKENPSTPTFTDVLPSHIFYQHIEGAYEIGLIGGYDDGTFRPGNPVTRQQTNSILARYLSDAEIAAKGYIQVGNGSKLTTLEDWYKLEGDYYLLGFEDGGQVLEVHRPGTAYLIARGVVKGSNERLNPGATLSRAQAVALIVRTGETMGEIGNPPPAPTDLTTLPPSPSNASRPTIMGRTIPHGQVIVQDAFDGAFADVADGIADSTGDFSVKVDNPLMEGPHSFRVRVKDRDGFSSDYSVAVPYLLDLTPPEGGITVPLEGGATNVRKPLFQVSATDGDGAGVDAVSFAYRALGAATFVTISVDGTPQADVYEASWGDILLPDGVYELQATVTDRAGNSRLLGPIEATVDLNAPTVVLEQPSTEDVFITSDTQPLFLASADDTPPPANPEATPSGLAQVDFMYALLADLPGDPGDWTAADFMLISSSLDPETRAVWGDLALDDGRYVFAVQSIDRAANASGLETQEVVVDTTAPEAPTGVTYTDDDATPGVDGRDFTVGWTPSVSVDVAAQRIFILPVGVDLDLGGSAPHAPVFEFEGNIADNWQGTVDLTDDSAGDAFSAETDYTVYVVAVDRVGLASEPASATVDTPSELSAADVDTNEGVDGRDFSVDWTPSVCADVVSQLVFILPVGVDLVLTGPGAHTPVSDPLNPSTASWQGDEAITEDSAGGDLAAGDYDVYVVAVDENDRGRPSLPDTMTAIADAP